MTRTEYGVEYTSVPDKPYGALIRLNESARLYTEAEAVEEAESFRNSGIDARVVSRQVSEWEPHTDQ